MNNKLSGSREMLYLMYSHHAVIIFIYSSNFKDYRHSSRMIVWFLWMQITVYVFSWRKLWYCHHDDRIPHPKAKVFLAPLICTWSAKLLTFDFTCSFLYHLSSLPKTLQVRTWLGEIDFQLGLAISLPFSALRLTDTSFLFEFLVSYFNFSLILLVLYSSHFYVARFNFKL